MAGSRMSDARKQAVAEKLHQYTGLPVAYLLKANLRVSGGMFEHELQADGDITTGRLDTRFSGPTIDPLGTASEYDPQIGRAPCRERVLPYLYIPVDAEHIKKKRTTK